MKSSSSGAPPSRTPDSARSATARLGPEQMATRAFALVVGGVPSAGVRRPVVASTRCARRADDCQRADGRQTSSATARASRPTDRENGRSARRSSGGGTAAETSVPRRLGAKKASDTAARLGCLVQCDRASRAQVVIVCVSVMVVRRSVRLVVSARAWRCVPTLVRSVLA
jgi:hypothetical protein